MTRIEFIYTLLAIAGLFVMVTEVIGRKARSDEREH